MPRAIFPDNVSLTELLLPLPLAAPQARSKQRWWDNTFPQTVVGATLETVQMALAGTFLALFVAFPVGFSPHATPRRIRLFTISCAGH